MSLSIIVPIKPPEPFYPILREKICEVFAGEDFEILEQYERGLVNAVAHGVWRSSKELVAVLDADGSHRPVDLLELYRWAVAGDYDLVVGSKVLGVDYSPFYRKAFSSLYRLLVRSFLGFEVKDVMSGIVVCKRELMLKIKPISEYKYLLQVLLYAKDVAELPIVFLPRKQGKSKVNPVISILTLYNAFKLRRKWAGCQKTH